MSVHGEYVMNNAVKEKLLAGQLVLGTFVWSMSEVVTECMGYTGMDYVVFDSEHSAVDTEGAIQLIRVAQMQGLSPIVRVKDASRAAILKMLDCGAQALIVPGIKTVDEVRRMVEYGKYPPVGQRGFAMSRRAGYGFAESANNLSSYFETSNATTMLLPMCETAEALESIEEIVRVEGVDGIYVGPYDLSISLGIAGEFAHPNFMRALQRIVAACKAVGKYAFIFSNSVEAAQQHIAMGFHAPTLSGDTIMLIKAYKTQVEQVRAGK